MANSFAASRAQLIFALCLPAAVLLGYLLAEPTDFTSMFVVMLVLGALSVPLLMHWYHPLLLFTWNAAITPYFLPGQPFVWMLFAFLGFGFAVVNRFTSAEARFIPMPSVNRPLLALLTVVLVTAFLRGGFGLAILRSGQYGGKSNFYIIAAILGYFAIISQRIPKHRARLFVGIFFAAGLTSLIPNLAYLAGPRFDLLFYLFPPVYAAEQAAGDYSLSFTYARIYGLTFGSNALYCALLARYGLRGIFDVKKPFRILLFAAATLGCLYCGFRSFMVLFVLTIAAQFVAEKLFNLRSMLIAGACAVVIGAITIPNADRLPLVVQRSISFLPVPIRPDVKLNAQLSSEWRIEMWKDVVHEIPRYLLVGKGYKLDPAELEMALEEYHRGWGRPYAWAMVTGSYHSGPLTLVIPFGLFGFGAFAWFIIAAIKYLYRNFKYGDPELKNINTFLLAYFVARLVYYVVVFGNFFTDLFVFTGVIALSISVNGPETTQIDPEAAEAETTEAHDEDFGALGQR